MKTRIAVPPVLKNWLLTTRGNVCEACNTVEFDHIHHVDENPSNNNPLNLKLLCFKCHVKVHRGEISLESELYDWYDDTDNVWAGRILTEEEVRDLARKPYLWSSIINFDLKTSGFMEGVIIDES